MDSVKSFLLTDLYQLATMEAYLANAETETAVFEVFVRKLPKRCDFFMSAGLEPVLAFLEDLHVPETELNWLARSGQFGQAFLDYLSYFRFTGDVHAMPEGTVFFPNEPILCITSLEDDTQEGTPLIQCVMRSGNRVGAAPDLQAARAHAAAELMRLSDALGNLDPTQTYPVRMADKLINPVAEVDCRMARWSTAQTEDFQ